LLHPLDCYSRSGRGFTSGATGAASSPSKHDHELIASGPYAIVRHPIYTLSILLILGTLATTPTPVMLVIAIVHIACLQFEAHREEAYLLGKHGRAYADYRKRVGRFFPRTASFMIGDSWSR
jgi:protein-S-isoprenylcysteine O-methyltransferase Ste14